MSTELRNIRNDFAKGNETVGMPSIVQRLKPKSDCEIEIAFDSTRDVIHCPTDTTPVNDQCANCGSGGFSKAKHCLSRPDHEVNADEIS